MSSSEQQRHALPVRPHTLGDWLEALGRRAGLRAKAEGRLRVMETLQLGGRRSIVLAECDGQRYLIGLGAESVGSIVRMGGEEPRETSQ